MGISIRGKQSEERQICKKDGGGENQKGRKAQGGLYIFSKYIFDEQVDGRFGK